MLGLLWPPPICDDLHHVPSRLVHLFHHWPDSRLGKRSMIMFQDSQTRAFITLLSLLNVLCIIYAQPGKSCTNHAPILWSQVESTFGSLAEFRYNFVAACRLHCRTLAFEVGELMKCITQYPTKKHREVHRSHTIFDSQYSICTVYMVQAPNLPLPPVFVYGLPSILKSLYLHVSGVSRLKKTH